MKANPDIQLVERCHAILRERGSAMDSLQMSRLLREDSSACYRALMSIPGVKLSGMGMLQQFSLEPK